MVWLVSENGELHESVKLELQKLARSKVWFGFFVGRSRAGERERQREVIEVMCIVLSHEVGHEI